MVTIKKPLVPAVNALSGRFQAFGVEAKVFHHRRGAAGESFENLSIIRVPLKQHGLIRMPVVVAKFQRRNARQFKLLTGEELLPHLTDLASEFAKNYQIQLVDSKTVHDPELGGYHQLRFYDPKNPHAVPPHHKLPLFGGIRFPKKANRDSKLEQPTKLFPSGPA
jgi:hypothetical protein